MPRAADLAVTISCLLFLGLLAATVAPAFFNMIDLGAQGVTKSDLRFMRERFVAYRAEHSENPPALEALVDGKSHTELPALWRGIRFPHKRTRGTIALPDTKPTDSGLWAYAVGASTPIFIDCTHTDARGNVWAAY